MAFLLFTKLQMLQILWAIFSIVFFLSGKCIYFWPRNIFLRHYTVSCTGTSSMNGRMGEKPYFLLLSLGKWQFFEHLFSFFFVYERFSWDNLCLLEFCPKIYVRSSSRATFAQSHFINLIFCRAEWRKTHLIPCLPDYYYYASYQH